jgi:hypothetical protein
MKTSLVLLLLALPLLLSALSLSKKGSICAYNSLGFVAGDPNYTFFVNNKLFTPNYTPQDFNITNWSTTAAPSHPFFDWIGLNGFRNAFQTLGCDVVPVSMYGKVCGVGPSTVNSTYQAAFGPDIVFKCRVPKNHLVLNVKFVPKIDKWNTTAAGGFSIFQGLYNFSNLSEAKAIIQREGTAIVKQIQLTNLTTLDINSCLNQDPNATLSMLASEFNAHIHTYYALNMIPFTKHPLVDEGYITILPPGTSFIAGAVVNGTVSVKQVCDSYTFTSKDNCGLTL